MANNEEGVEPMHKKQKCGEVNPSPTFGGGPMYDEATARKMLKEAVRVEAYYNEDGEGAVIGFDPDDAALDNLYEAPVVIIRVGSIPRHKITPMMHFAREGGLKMCRYLASRGASTTKASGRGDWSPMFAAAYGGHLDVCKFLFANGANSEIRRETPDGWTPLAYAAVHEDHEIVRWLVLEGALCIDDGSDGRREGGRFYPKSEWPLNVYFERLDRSRERLVEWAEEVTQTHASIITFLHGTRPPPSGTDGRSNLECLSVHPGIRKHICDFVGQEVTKKRHLHILRQVKTALPYIGL